ncbi:MAG: hypothetical protein KC449_00250 [Anaerolineales bacterium]|nr:hypothetical protein [Anaerolineales bacterium]
MSFVIVSIMCVGIMACTTLETNEPVYQAEETRSAQSATASSTPLPVVTVLPSTIQPSPTTTVDNSVIQTPVAISATVVPDVSFDLVQIATIEPVLSIHSSLPETVWWSEDSQTVYYQDVEAQQAWAYDIYSGNSTSIPYVPRTYRELAPQIEATLPENAELLNLSPISSRKILYRLPLPVPIPFPDEPDNPDYPPYSYTLWLREDGQDFQLGLIDSCFGVLGPPIWSTNENVAIVNTAGTPGYRCLHSSWLIDLDTLSVGQIDTPWEGEKSLYSVRDLSADGEVILVRAETNYFYNRATKEQWSIPNADTDKAILLDPELTPRCIYLESEFSDTFLETHIRYCDPANNEDFVLEKFEGHIVDWIISPNRRFIALIAGEQDFLPGVEDLPVGIWLMALPIGS